MSDRLASALGASTYSRTPDQSAFDATAVNTWSAFRHRRGSAESVGQSHLVFQIGSPHSRPGEERNNPNTPLGGRHSSAIHPTKDEHQRDQDLERARDAPLRAPAKQMHCFSRASLFLRLLNPPPAAIQFHRVRRLCNMRLIHEVAHSLKTALALKARSRAATKQRSAAS